MKNRNGLLLLGALLASASLVACSSSTNTKGKGIVQLMNDNQERVFYEVDDIHNYDKMPGKDDLINRIYITKGGKLKEYEITSSNKDLHMDDVVGKSINEVRKLAEENSERTFENDKVTAEVTTDSSGNNTTKETIRLNDHESTTYDSLTSGQIRDKYYAGYVDGDYLLVTEVSKGDVINFDKADGKIVKEK